MCEFSKLSCTHRNYNSYHQYRKFQYACQSKNLSNKKQFMKNLADKMNRPHLTEMVDIFELH